MALTKPEVACDHVIQTLKISRLTFQVQETPYSAYITIRKKFTSNPPSDHSPSSLSDLQTPGMCQTFENLVMENSSLKDKLGEVEQECDALTLENKKLCESFGTLSEACGQRVVDNDAIKTEKNNAVKEKDNLQKIIVGYKLENEQFKDDLESLEKDQKSFNKTLKLKDKQVYDLEKNNSKLKEELLQERSEFALFKSQVNKERKEAEKKRKKTEKKDFLDNLKVESKHLELKCKCCDESVSSAEDLRKHMLRLHIKCSSTQTNTEVLIEKKVQVRKSDFNSDKSTETTESAPIVFKKYSCIYCGFNIVSESHLKDHIVSCPGSHRPSFLKLGQSAASHSKSQQSPELNQPIPLTLSSRPQVDLFSLPFGLPNYTQTFPYYNPGLSRLPPKCEHCGWIASCGTDLVKHKKSVHADHRNPFEI